MDRTAVISSNIEGIGYDAEHQVVEVEFKGGRVYHYLDVDPEAWADREGAESIGKWVSGVLKPMYAYLDGAFEPPDDDEEADEGDGEGESSPDG